jgi:hypothetical protein
LNTGNYVVLLRSEVFPVIEGEYPDNYFYFMHDRAPAHTSNLTREFIREVFLVFHDRLLPRPPKGADLNIIENLWSMLAYGVSQMMRMFGIPQNRDELWEIVIAIWNAKRSSGVIESLNNSMPARIHDCINLMGVWTKY